MPHVLDSRPSNLQLTAKRRQCRESQGNSECNWRGGAFQKFLVIFYALSPYGLNAKLEASKLESQFKKIVGTEIFGRIFLKNPPLALLILICKLVFFYSFSWSKILDSSIFKTSTANRVLGCESKLIRNIIELLGAIKKDDVELAQGVTEKLIHLISELCSFSISPSNLTSLLRLATDYRQYAPAILTSLSVGIILMYIYNESYYMTQ